MRMNLNPTLSCILIHKFTLQDEGNQIISFHVDFDHSHIRMPYIRVHLHARSSTLTVDCSVVFYDYTISLKIVSI